MFKSEQLTWLDWIVLFFTVPIPGVNVVFIAILIYRIGFLKALVRILILLVIYLVAVFIGLMFISF